VEENNQGNVCSIRFRYRNYPFDEGYAIGRAGGRLIATHIVVAANGKIYMLQPARFRDNTRTSEQIKVFDVASGRHLNTINVVVPSNPPSLDRSLILSNNHLLLVLRRRHNEARAVSFAAQNAHDESSLATQNETHDESFANNNAGLNVRALALVDNGLVETSCEDGRGEFSLNMDPFTKQTNACLIYYHTYEKPPLSNRVVSINGDDDILRQEGWWHHFRNINSPTCNEAHHTRCWGCQTGVC
jgi:hypothetical protein